MIDKKFLLVIVCSVFVWLFYLFCGQPLVGADSYYYLNMVCGITSNTDSNIGFSLLLIFIPCNVFVIKTIYLILWIVVLFVIYNIGRLFDKDLAWWFPGILFAFTFFITEFWKFENDAFGFVFSFVGFYFILKHCVNCKWLDWKSVWNKEIVLGLMFFVLAGLFWKGSIYWFYSLGFVNIIFLFFAVILFLFNSVESFWFLNSNPVIYENIPLLAIIFFGVSIFFVYGVVKNSRKINGMLFFLLIPALWMNKFFVLPILFLVVTCFNGLKLLGNKDLVGQTLLVFVFFMTFFWCVNLGYQFPQQVDVVLIDDAVGIDVNVNNTFGTGYLIINRGGIPSFYGSYTKEPLKKGVVVDVSDKNVPENCELIKQTRYLLLEVCK